MPERPAHRRRAVRAAGALVVAAATLAAAACGNSSDGKAPARRPPAHARRLLAELKRPYLSMRAPDAPGDSEFDRVPLDLWGPFRWEATFGVYDASRTAGLENTFFGTELNTRGAPTHEYYGIYAHLEGGGVFVIVETDAGVIGSTTYAGVTRVEAVVEHDGQQFLFHARPAGSSGAYDLLATLPYAQTVPLNPAIGTFNFAGNAEVGFDRLRVVSNSAAPAPVGETHAAVDAIFAAMGPMAEARYALGEDPADTAGAAAFLDGALVALDETKGAIGAAAEAAKRPNPFRTSVTEVKKVRRRVSKVRSRLRSRGARARAAALRDIAVGFYGLAKAADAILPQDLRDSLPGTVHTLK